MNPHLHSRSPRPPARRAVATAVALLTALGSVTAAADAPARAQEGRANGGGLKEVGTLPALDPIEFSNASANGWLILNPRTRRAYEIFESGPQLKMVIQSFDLDTLKPIRRAEIVGRIPVVGGTRIGGSGGNIIDTAGGVVHAVDEIGEKVYLGVSNDDLALKTAFTSAGGNSSDSARPFTAVLEVDERAFNGGAAESHWKREIETPTTQAALPPLKVWLRGLDVVRPDGKPKLLLQFADPGSVPKPAYNHVLTQWDLGPLDATGAAIGDWHVPLTACNSEKYTTDANYGMYEKDILYRPDAIYLMCGATGGSARVVKVPLVNGAAQPGAVQEAFPLSRPATDVIVDQRGQRIIMRSPASGVTWWVFDARHDHYVAALAGGLHTAANPAAGVDQVTGRFYTFGPNYQAAVGGRSVPQQGGLFVSDARLDPAPALENVAPELAYPGQYRIVVDPPTRRVFVRRGTSAVVSPGYPDPTPVPSPQERFYRVFEDRIPLTEQPKDAGDAGFTTQVDEAPGLTSSSYLGTASGFGSRLVLTGGVSAVTQRLTDPAQSPCGPEDREITAGEVLVSTLSDLSVGAEATALAADPTTKQTTEKPVQRCWPNPLNDPRLAAFPTGWPPRDAPGLFRFDTNQSPDDPADDFTSECVDDATTSRAPRGGFKSEAKCEREKEQLRATAEGYFAPAFTQTLPNGTSETLSPVRVGYSNSTVTIERDKQNGGVVATVDSIARNIEIPGVGSIGLVRMEAISRSTGRTGGAKGTFTRTVCGVDILTVRVTHCISETDQHTILEGQLNAALAGHARFRFRRPDPALLAGSAHGYQAGVQRDRLELFEDQAISRDDSQAVAGLEFVSYRGDSASAGAGRQILQFAGVQASTTYGIGCLLGRSATGGCSDGSFGAFGDGLGGDAGFSSTDPNTSFDGATDPGTLPSIDMPVGGSGGKGGGLGGLVRRLLAVPADVLRLLFASPREFALMAAVWALLWVPCYLGERRRTLAGLAQGGAAQP